MTESSLPPPPPTHSNGLLVGLGLLGLLVVGALVLWRMNTSDSAQTSADAVTAAVTASVQQAGAPPPPPPPPPAQAAEGEGLVEGDTEAEATGQQNTWGRSQVNKSAAKSQVGVNAPNPGSVPSGDGCAGTCPNRVDAALNQALRQRGASAKNCYNAALRSNPTLQGKVVIKVRISPSGSTCAASIASDTLGDPSVTSCIVQKFKSGGYPKPTSGCADFEVPLSFVPSGS